MIDALLDTGAETPIWCKGEKKLLLAYPDAVKQDWESEIRGFGKDAEKGAVYAIPEFSLTDGKECYGMRLYVIHTKMLCSFVRNMALIHLPSNRI